MLRSMTTAVTGMRGHQQKLDVIGNNIANVNTVGFKKSQARFEDLISQNIQGATRPGEERGGINPSQIGLGMRVSSIVNIHSQGAITSTDRITDLAIEGGGFFVVSPDEGGQLFYTRNGSFGRDANGDLVNDNGLKVMGWPGVDEAGGDLVPLNIPIGDEMAAQATSELVFSGNLDAGLPEKATLSTGTAGTANAQAVGVQDDPAGNSLTITAENAAAGAVGNDVTINWEQIDGTANPVAVYDAANRTITITADFDNNLNVTYNDIAGVINALGDFSALVIGNGAQDIDLAGGAIGDGITVPEPGLFAGGSDALDDITWTAIEPGTGGNNIEVVYQPAPAAGNPTAVNVIGNQVVVSLGRDAGGFVDATATDVINAVNNDAMAGSLIRGSTSGAGTGRVQPMAAQNLAGGGASIYTYEYYLYDSLGERYDVDLTFTGLSQNSWGYDLEVTDGEGNQVALAAGANGTLVFDTAGSLDEDASAIPNIVFNPPGADQINVEPQFGTITQLSGASTLLVRSQDGYAAGELIAFSITRTGEIIGTYTNGLFDGLGQIAMSYFTNPEGLQNDGGNLFQETVNSGEARTGLPGTEGRGMIMSSALELSNVDLAFEFTELITTSRGFQAGTRVVTTSDEVLVEVINMKR